MTRSLLPSMQASKLGFAFAIFAIASLGLFVSTASAATHWVDPAAAAVAPGTACGALAGYTSINTAIAAAVASDVVMVCAGTYNEDVNVNKSIILVGDGIGFSIIQGQGLGEAGALVISADDVGVGGFTVLGSGVSAIRISGARDNVVIVDNRAVAAAGKNAFLTDGGQSNHQIEDNLFEGNASQLVYVNGTASVANASTNVDFIGNTFAGTATGPALGMEADNSEVHHNVFTTPTNWTTIENFGTGNVINRNSITNSGTGSGLVSFALVDGTCNWWGNASGPSGEGLGTGESVSTLVDFDPWLLSSDLDEECPPLPPPPPGTGVINSSIIKIEAKNSGHITNYTSSKAETGGNTAEGSRGGRGGRGGDVEAEAESSGSGDAKAKGNNGGAIAGNGGAGGNGSLGGEVTSGNATSVAETDNSMNDTDIWVSNLGTLNSSKLKVEVDNDDCRCNTLDNRTKSRARTGGNTAEGSFGGSGGSGGEVEADAEATGSGEADTSGNNGGAMGGDGGTGGTGAFGGIILSGIADSFASTTNRVNTTRVRVNN